MSLLRYFQNRRTWHLRPHTSHDHLYQKCADSRQRSVGKSSGARDGKKHRRFLQTFVQIFRRPHLTLHPSAPCVPSNTTLRHCEKFAHNVCNDSQLKKCDAPCPDPKRIAAHVRTPAPNPPHDDPDDRSLFMFSAKNFHTWHNFSRKEIHPSLLTPRLVRPPANAQPTRAPSDLIILVALCRERSSQNHLLPLTLALFIPSSQ